MFFNIKIAFNWSAKSVFFRSHQKKKRKKKQRKTLNITVKAMGGVNNHFFEILRCVKNVVLCNFLPLDSKVTKYFMHRFPRLDKVYNHNSGNLRKLTSQSTSTR